MDKRHLQPDGRQSAPVIAGPRRSAFGSAARRCLLALSLMAMPWSLSWGSDALPYFKPVYFASDSLSLSGKARTELAVVARIMAERPDLLITLEGHTDERGSDEFSLAVGERRARVVMDYLMRQGVPRARLSCLSAGNSRPADPRHSRAAWARNRRVEIIARLPQGPEAGHGFLPLSTSRSVEQPAPTADSSAQRSVK